MDRNRYPSFTTITLVVASREGRVDRNRLSLCYVCYVKVASREGRVDRNTIREKHHAVCNRSRPVRGAWIEIAIAYTSKSSSIVASREGRVDRNNINLCYPLWLICRVP